MKNTMNKWCEYQKRSKWARRRFSIANQTIIIRATVIIHPVRPGPVVKLMLRNATKRFAGVVADVSAIASLAKLNMCATTWTTVKNTMDQATALWKVMFLSNGIIPFNGVRRNKEIKFRQTGSKIGRAHV